MKLTKYQYSMFNNKTRYNNIVDLFIFTGINFCLEIFLATMETTIICIPVYTMY